MADTVKFLYRQFFLIPTFTSPKSVSLQGKTALVTGSNIGLGLECARQLLSLHLSRLVLDVRSLKKSEDARTELAKDAPWATIEVWHLDMSDYASVRAFAEKCKGLEKGGAGIDYSVLNVEILKVNMEINALTGYEEVLQVNYLSTALLALLLLPSLANRTSKNQSAKPGTLTIVGSETAEWAKFPEQHSPHGSILAAFNDPKNFDLQDRY